MLSSSGATAHRRKFSSSCGCLSRGRIKSQALLLVKHIVTDSTCEVYQSAVEDAEHIIFGCPVARSFWCALGIDVMTAQVRALWNMARPSAIPARHHSVFLHLCCWNLWKHRNEVVFRHESPSLPRLLLHCRSVAALWRCRLPAADANVSVSWRSTILNKVYQKKNL